MELLFPLLILALLVPMFLGIRRQKKEMQKTADLQDSLKIGDRVMTTAGLHATVAGLDEGTVDLEIAPVSSPPGRGWSSVSMWSTRTQPAPSPSSTTTRPRTTRSVA